MPEPSRFPTKAFSAVEDVKGKAQALSEEARREISEASEGARAKTGQIPLYSAKFYAACAFGGLLACVGIPVTDCS